jgi:hypothetical protein
LPCFGDQNEIGLETADESLRYIIYMIEKGVKLAAEASI